MPSRNKKSVVFFVKTDTKDAVNNSRFKFFLIPQEALHDEANLLRPRLEPVFARFDNGELSTPEFVFLVIAHICEQRRQGQWWMRGKSEFTFPKRDVTRFATVCDGLNIPEPVHSLFEFFSKYRLKNLPQGVARILYLWDTEQAQLELSEHAISPEAMLALQADGRRIVTLSREALLAGKLVDGKRDALEFLLHDMAHANLFFSETQAEQIHFFKTLHIELQKKNISEAILDPQFKTALEYIMSDMNSSSAHLTQSLKAALIDQKRREQGLAKNAMLSGEDEKQLAHEWAALWLQ